MARAYQLISADSHILEPPHLWRQYMPRKFHDKAPTVVPDGEGGEAWQFAPDAPPAPIGIYASAGRKHEDVRWTGVTFAEANQGNFRAEPRLAEQDVDGWTPRAGMQARPIRRSGAAFTNSSAIQLL